MKMFSLKEDGFCGAFFKGTKYLDKAIIFMSGAGISQKGTQASATFLVNQGYSVLVLGFYKWKGLPKEMYGIPVEYVQRAISWLLSHQDQQIKRIAIMGTSTGAGYALLCASLFRQISCVIAVSPFDYIMEGADRKFRRTHKSTYTCKGVDIPFTPNTPLDKGVFSLLHQAKNDKQYTLRRAMRYVYDINPPSPSSRIKLEDMHADILLLAAQDDDFWPADEAVSRMKNRLLEMKYPYRVKSVVYEKASHLLGYIPTINPLKKMLIKAAIAAENKYPKECEDARRDSTQQILTFLYEW